MGRMMTGAIIIGAIVAVVALDVFGLGWALRKAWRNMAVRRRRPS
jgi:hypothetical protein